MDKGLFPVVNNPPFQTHQGSSPDSGPSHPKRPHQKPPSPQQQRRLKLNFLGTTKAPASGGRATKKSLSTPKALQIQRGFESAAMSVTSISAQGPSTVQPNPFRLASSGGVTITPVTIPRHDPSIRTPQDKPENFEMFRTPQRFGNQDISSTKPKNESNKFKRKSPEAGPAIKLRLSGLNMKNIVVVKDPQPDAETPTADESDNGSDEQEDESNEDDKSDQEEEEEDAKSVVTEESQESQEDPAVDEGSARRTGRTRKPIKHFSTDMTRSAKRRLAAAAQDPEDASSSTEMTMDSSVEITTKVRGRPRGTGRGRGRPRGSTLKAKLEREAAATLETLMDNGASATSPTTTTTTPVRGSRRGGRGSRGRGLSRKMLNAKRRANLLVKAKAVIEAKSSLPPSETFEDETLMSGEIKSLPTDKLLMTPMMDEDASNMSSNSTSTNNMSIKAKKFTKDLVVERKPVTAETLFEYQWPPNNQDSDFYFLQEQIIEFLGHKSFRRKYPNLIRRPVEMEERDFLREKKIVSETQCDLGLTAVNSGEVLDILYKDFPDKYEEFRKIEEDRREKELTRNQAACNNNTRDRSAEFIRRITKSCSLWNAKFNQERKENRSSCFDLQTCTMNVPAGSMKTLPSERTKLGYFPVPVIHGQFSDGYKEYTPVELKYLPFNTVMYGPIQDNKTVDEDTDDSDSDSGDSSSSNDTSSTSGDDVDSVVGHAIIGMDDVDDSKDSLGFCKTCNGDRAKNKDGKPEILIHCAKCDSANHPTCLELTLDMLPYIKRYDWQCTDCKNCIECNDPADEDKMLFCDCCDRGYHIYCVGLRKVPTGRWHCISCSICHSCGTNEPSGDDRNAEWHHEYKKGEKGSKYFLHSLCAPCHKVFKKGHYCPYCLKVHLNIEAMKQLLIECRSCERWVHKQCVKRSLTTKFGFICDFCDDPKFTVKTKLPAPLDLK